MSIFYLFFGGLLFFMGLVVHKGKAYFLISGYNTYSKEKKEKVQVEDIAKNMGLYGYVNGAAGVLAALLSYVGVKNLLLPVMVVFFVSTGVLLVTSQKYDRNMYDEEGKMTRKNKGQMMLLGIFSLALVIFVGGLFWYSSQAITVSYKEDSFELHGMYGEEVFYEELLQVELVEDLPQILMRTNGSALGEHLRGHFRLEEVGSAKLLLRKDRPPYILLKTESGLIYVNLKTVEETKALYETIRGTSK